MPRMMGRSCDQRANLEFTLAFKDRELFLCDIN